MEQELEILILEDVPEDAELMLRELRKVGINFSIRRVGTEADFRSALAALPPDVILSDFSLPHFDGMSALGIAHQACPDIPFIFVSGVTGEERAIEALKHGATDYILKGNLKRLAPAVRRALRERDHHAARWRAEEALQAAEKRYRNILDLAADAVISVDRNQRIKMFNRSAERIFGYAFPEVAGQPLDLLLPQRFIPAHGEHMRGFTSAPETARPVEKRQELYGRRKDGREFPAEVGISKIIEKGEVTFTAIVRDITQHKNQEERIARLSRVGMVLSGINSTIVRLHDRQELFDEACRIAVEHGNFGMAWIGLLDHDTMEVKPVAYKGIEIEQQFLSSIKLSARGDLPEDQGTIGQALRSKKPAFCNNLEASPQIGIGGEEAIRRGCHSVIALPLLMEDTVAGVFVLYAKEPELFDEEELRLLTELAGDISFALGYIEKREKVDYLAFYDALTGLPNRNLFTDRLSQHIGPDAPRDQLVAVAILDMERLRLINDSLGRHVGDALLKHVSQCLRSTLSDASHAARLGGDQFAVVFTAIRDEPEAAHLVQELIGRVEAAALDFEERKLEASVKAGVALFPADGRNADALLANAEAALKKAKSGGDKLLFYKADMNARMADRLTLEAKLRRALEKEQFVLHYQPKVDIATGRINNLEALIRWNDPDRGLVSPALFIPILEETGLILKVGAWAMAEASRASSAWMQKGLPPIRIAVNVSPIQLRQKDFVESAKRAMTACGTDFCGLDLEITESVIMDNIEENIAKLWAIRDAGGGIAIDDFGTGYSSLSYLHKLPVSALKIDRSFITNLATNADSMAIVSTIITLAHSLNLKVIAEGVETRDQERILRLLRCNEYQGYLFSRPVPAEQIEAMLGQG